MLRLTYCLLAFCMSNTFSAILKNGNQQIKIILDIDPGVDDIEALVILLAQKNIEIVGIIVSEGNTSQVHGLRNLQRILDAAHCTKIPIWKGSASTLSNRRANLGNFYGLDGFGDLKDIPISSKLSNVTTTGAIENIKYWVNKHPKQITYIVLGPMTNLAIAMIMYPEVRHNLNEIYAMGGLKKESGAGEVNVLFDPIAVDNVLDLVRCPMTLFTWEACIHNAPEQLWFEHASFHNDVFNLVLKAEKSLVDLHPNEMEWIRCDPMAVVTFLDGSSILDSYSSPLKVEVCETAKLGVVSHSKHSERAPIKVIMEMDYAKGMAMFLESFETNKKYCDY